LEGWQCYGSAYYVTLAAGVVGMAVCLWSVWHENQVHKKNGEKKTARWRRSDHERGA